MELFIPVIDWHLALVNLRTVDPGQDVEIKLLPFKLGIGRVPPGVGEQVSGKALVIPLRPE